MAQKDDMTDNEEALPITLTRAMMMLETTWSGRWCLTAGITRTRHDEAITAPKAHDFPRSHTTRAYNIPIVQSKFARYHPLPLRLGGEGRVRGE